MSEPILPIPEANFVSFTGSSMFDRWSAGKMFSIESPRQTGEHLHQHDYYQIWYVERGRCEHLIEGQSHVMDTGDVFILPPGVTHRTMLQDHTKILCCEFALEDVLNDSNAYYRKLREITQGMSFRLLFRQELDEARDKFTLSTGTRRQVEHLMHSMLDEYERQDLCYEDILQLKVLELLLLLLREYATLPYEESDDESFTVYRELIASAIEYIDTHYDENLTLDAMCRQAAMSKTYFCYLFKMETRMTFMEYLTDVRMRHAEEALASSSRPVSVIASEVGFRDPSHFSRTFRKSLGMSPSQYRKKYRR